MRKNYWEHNKNRYYIIQFIIIIFFLLFTFRAYKLSFYSPIPVNERDKTDTIKRGTIFDSHNHELAVSRDTFSIALRPKEIINHEQTVFLLSKILNLSEQSIYEKLNINENFVWLKLNLPLDTADEIRKLKLPGVVFEKTPQRFYPNQELASSLLGFVGRDHEGLEGIEYQFQELLTKKTTETHAGNNIYLTIDAYIQHQLEKSLKKAFIKTQSKKALGIISHVHSGKILAMASFPDFNPNNPYNNTQYKNLAITETYEPGSTFKIFILAALINENLLNKSKSYYCPGYFEKKGNKINCSGKHGRQNIMDVIKNSCNTGIIEASWQMPVLRLYENLIRFGFGSKTGINLPAESKGILPNPDKWDIFLKMTIPIGHGISATPIQLIRAANAIGNHGFLIKPYLIEKISSPDGKKIEYFENSSKIRIISEESAKEVLKFMTAVTQKGGTGEKAALGEFVISGKTGTSIKSDNRGYLKGKYQSSFLGFFPGDFPEVSILIWLDEPQGQYYQGGRIAAPIFKEVLQEIITLVHKGNTFNTELLPDISFKKNKYSQNKMPNFLGKSKKEIIFILNEQFQGKHTIFGKGYAIRQEPAPGEKISQPYNFKIQLDFPE
ncbi:MAG: penicillin-binding transpeptidase domain-containing protein [Spirochaetia bacterium]|nr:penicillin-binding transpeptidase domain-containing protein [Spirochaetia bacterium]